VLLLGARGFLGRHLASSLREAGCVLREGVRRPATSSEIAVDFARDTDPAVWLPRLGGIEVVINAVGILRETTKATFAPIHRDTPIALLHACEQAGVKRLIQISALGIDDQASEDALAYFASKAAADHAFLASPLEVVVIRPSLVFGLDGVSSKALLAAASLPLHVLPGAGAQPIQPIHIDDLGALVARLACAPTAPPRLVEAVGPRVLDFAEMLAVYRRNLGLPPAVALHLPMPWVRCITRMAEWLPQRVVARETLAMLERGNTGAVQPVLDLLGRPPRAPEDFVAPAEREAARHLANAQWLFPLARLSLALLWIFSGLIGWFFADDTVAAWLARLGLDAASATGVLLGASMLDLVLGLLTLCLPSRTLWLTQLLLVLVYTPLASFAAPEAWVHPFGPLLKNLPILVLLLWLWANTTARKS
jgi:uncharacterized protein YbjT (DUF2867 family)